MARCGCGGSCGCSLTSGTNTTVIGAGSAANPWQVNAVTNCTEVRNCLTGSQGVFYNPTTGNIRVCLSSNANNALTRDATGCLYVGAGASTVTTGCGITGNGSVSTPVAANVSAWPYTCPIDTQGGVVSCDPATGRLWSEPRSRSAAFTTNLDLATGGAVPTTSTQSNLITTLSFPVTNPDTCRAATVLQLQEMAFVLTLPAGGRAEYGFLNNNMVNHTNRGATTEQDFYVQVSKALPLGTIAPGATQTFSFGMYLGQGTAGATWTALHAILRVVLVTA